MYGLRYSLALLAVGAVSMAGDVRAQEKYPFCAGSYLLIGEAPNKPFVANVVTTSWEAASDGSRKAVDLPKGDHAYFVARDSKGRVVIKGRTVATTKSPEGNGESPVEEETICDPDAGTVTRVSYQDVFYRFINLSTKQATYQKAGVGGVAFVDAKQDTRTTESFQWFRRTVAGRDNLGSELFEGISAERYRFTKTHQDGSLHELVLSEELEADLASIRYVSYPITEQETKLDHIHHLEPSPAEFEIPQGVSVQRTQRKVSSSESRDKDQASLR
jgi:hypothetical protein